MIWEQARSWDKCFQEVTGGEDAGVATLRKSLLGIIRIVYFALHNVKFPGEGG